MRIESEQHPTKLLMNYYSRLYQGQKHDSPSESMVLLRRRVRKNINRLGSTDWVLDLGAGRQIFERGYRSAFGEFPCGVVTIDIAEIQRVKLLSKGRYSHIRGDGSILPFEDETFSLAFSNMAIDFMPAEAKGELRRVLKSNSLVHLNLHHPSLKDEDIEELLSEARKRKLTTNEKQVLAFWKYLKDNQILFRDEQEIESTFIACGFDVKQVKSRKSPSGKWWEVDMVRT